jgi:hypothetical protein
LLKKAKQKEGWCDMEKNKRLEQTETGAADRGDLVRRKMFKHMLRREFSDIPGGYGLPIKEAEEKVKKLERRAQAETGAADRQRRAQAETGAADRPMKKGGMAKMMKSEKASKMGKVATAKPKMGSASKRADGVAKKGKTKGTMMAAGGRAKMMAAGGKTKMMRSGGKSC